MHNVLNKNMTVVIILVAFCLLLSTNNIYAQHRGDNLSFQGIMAENGNGVKSQAMGGAYTSVSGDLEALFWNPAGLIGISSFQFSVAGNTYDQLWRENQEYRPNRQFVTFPFYLDGLYVPDPANNGRLDYEVFQEDSAYFVAEPVLGQDKYGEDAADWQFEKSGFIFNNFSAALPLNIADQQFVIAAAYAYKSHLLDYDRNQTYLDPHPGSDEYNDMIVRITDPGDSVRIHWSDFERIREGNIQSVNFALGYELSQNISLGLGVDFMNSETDDSQRLSRIGYFDLLDGANSFRFSYDTLNVATAGISKFSGTSFNLGAMFNFEHFSFGVNLTSPYTLTRKWNYKTTTGDANGSNTVTTNGQDEMKVPLSYAIGISLRPVESFRISIDLKQNNYGDAEFTYAKPDSFRHGWVDQTVVGFGFEYAPFDFLSILGGYRYQTEVYTPDGAALKDEGPGISSFSFGVSLKTDYGVFDLAYVIRNMKYYDAYYINTNYVTESLSRLYAGYTFTF